MKNKIIRRAFNAGEISKSAKWRNDTEKHGYACERLENFYVDVLGGIKRRKGTQFLAELGKDSDTVRIVPFEYNRELSFVLAFGTHSDFDVRPNWAVQTSKYGSYIKDGKLFYSRTQAELVERKKVSDYYADYASENGIPLEIARYKEARDFCSTLEHEAQALEAKRYEEGLTEGEEERLEALRGTLGDNGLIADAWAEMNDIAEGLKPLIWNAYNYNGRFESWEDFEVYNSDYHGQGVLNAIADNEYTFPLGVLNEELKVDFKIVEANVVYAITEAKNVKIKVNEAELKEGVNTGITCSEIVFTFEVDNYYNVDWEGDIYYESGVGSNAVKLEVFNVKGECFYTGTKTPISAEALNDFQYKQVGGDIYITHPKIAPQKLSFDGWKFNWSNAVKINPSLSEKDDVELSTASGGDSLWYSGDVIALNANKEYFTSDMVGRQLKIDYQDGASARYIWKNNSVGSMTAEFACCGKITISVQGGVWDGVLILEESTDNGKTWAEVGRSTSIQGSDNTSFEREFYDINTIVRCRMLEQNEVLDTNSTVVSDSTEGCMFNIIRDSTASVWVEVVNVSTDGRSANVRLLNPARSGFTSTAVYKDVWSDTLGFPRAVEIHEERLALAGTKSKPATIWLSEANRWDNFRSVSVLDTDPLEYTLASDDGEPISWLVSRSDLMIGMGTSEWSLGGRDASEALTASIVHASCQSDDGVEYIMPTKAGGMVIFVRRGNREIASFAYDYVNDSYNAMSLTTMNPDLLASGVKCLFNQLSPRNNIYAVLNNGEVAVFTYDKENNVCAWSRFTFGNGVISACALSTGAYRSVFLAVKRDGHITLERLDANEADNDNWIDCKGGTNEQYTSIVRTTPVFVDGLARMTRVGLYMLNSFGGEVRAVGYDQNGDEVKGEWRRILPREKEFLKEPKPRDYRFVQEIELGYLQEGAIEVRTQCNAPFELTAIGLG